MRRTAVLALLLAGLVVGTGCGGDEGDGGGAASKPTVEIPDGDPPTQLEIKDIKEGTGPGAVAGQQLTVHYVGVAWSDKQEFDASWNSGTPYPFKLGAGDVILGWDEGLVGMKVGGRRQLIIPPAMAYREFGQGSIKPNETLVFVVDLVELS